MAMENQGSTSGVRFESQLLETETFSQMSSISETCHHTLKGTPLSLSRPTTLRTELLGLLPIHLYLKIQDCPVLQPARVHDSETWRVPGPLTSGWSSMNQSDTGLANQSKCQKTNHCVLLALSGQVTMIPKSTKLYLLFLVKNMLARGEVRKDQVMVVPLATAEVACLTRSISMRHAAKASSNSAVKFLIALRETSARTFLDSRPSRPIKTSHLTMHINLFPIAVEYSEQNCHFGKINGQRSHTSCAHARVHDDDPQQSQNDERCVSLFTSRPFLQTVCHRLQSEMQSQRPNESGVMRE